MITWQEFDEWKKYTAENKFKYEPDDYFDDEELEAWNEDYDY